MHFSAKLTAFFKTGKLLGTYHHTEQVNTCPTLPHLPPNHALFATTRGNKFFLPRKRMPAAQGAMMPWRGSVNLLTRNWAFVFLSSIKGSTLIYIYIIYYI